MALNEFLAWFQRGSPTRLHQSHRERLAGIPGGPQTRLVVDPCKDIGDSQAGCRGRDNGLLAPELGAGISRVKSAKCVGIRVGNWLSVKQAQALLNAPDVTTVRGLRDRAILAVLLGCGLRRSEVAVLTFAHVQQRDGRWCIIDLVGKHGRVRTACNAQLGQGGD